MTPPDSGFDLDAFLGSLAQMGAVQPGDARPLIVRSADLHPLPFDSTHSPASLKIAGGLPTTTFEIFRQVISPGGSTDMQRHHHETVHFIIGGTGRSEIEDEEVPWSAGDFIYTPPWTWHRHYNTSDVDLVDFLTIENSRLLGMLGLNRRQSAGMVNVAEAREWEKRHDD